MHAKHTISAPTLSHHLKVLSDLGLITFRKEGLNVYYHVVPERFAAYLKYLADIGPKSR
jgi:ArsR family transcriptional regulator